MAVACAVQGPLGLPRSKLLLPKSFAKLKSTTSFVTEAAGA